MSRLVLLPFYFVFLIFLAMMLEGAYERGVSGLISLAAFAGFALAASKN